jgi:O-succinylhomoserine sulfhydrylase
LLKSLETLPLRVNQQMQSAVRLADYLAEKKGIKRVLYPTRKDHPQYDLAQKQMRGGGTVFSFELSGDKEAAFRFANALQIVKISNNLGDAKSIITHPATTTHQRLPLDVRLEMGIPEGLLRFSVGLEDVDDLIEDVNRGLAAL